MNITSPEIEPKVLKGCRKSDSKCQEILYRKFYAYGLSISLRYSYSREEAVEILNDSFLKVYVNISKFDTKKSFKSWFRRILINTSIDYYRKNKRLINTESIDDYNVDLNNYNEIDTMEVEDLLLLLNSLPELYRIIFNLHEIEGYKHEEIAKELNITAGTSRANLSRAKKILRESFKKQYCNSYARVI